MQMCSSWCIWYVELTLKLEYYYQPLHLCVTVCLKAKHRKKKKKRNCSGHHWQLLQAKQFRLAFFGGCVRVAWVYFFPSCDMFQHFFTSLFVRLSLKTHCEPVSVASSLKETLDVFSSHCPSVILLIVCDWATNCIMEICGCRLLYVLNL